MDLPDKTMSMQSIQIGDIYEILGKAILMGSQYTIMEAALRKSGNTGRLRTDELRLIFTIEGIHDQDAHKVAQSIGPKGIVELAALDETLNRAR